MAEPSVPPGSVSHGSGQVAISRPDGIQRRLVKLAAGSPAVRDDPHITRFDVAPGETLLVAGGETPLPAPGYDGDAGTLVVDLSAAQVTFRVQGPAARRLVAKAAAIDLDDRHFPAGAGTPCRFGAYRVLLHRVSADGYDLHVDRSLDHAMLGYLMELGAEFGIAPDWPQSRRTGGPPEETSHGRI